MIKRLFLSFVFLPILLAAQVQVFNAGIGGHNTKNGLSRISNLLKQYQPTILVIGYGANDSVNSKAIIIEKDFKNNLNKMIAIAKKHNVKTIVLNSCNPCIDSYLIARHKFKDNLLPSERIKKYNTFIQEVAKKNNVIFNDFHLAVMKNGGATGSRNSLIRNVANTNTKDGLHVTSKGAKLLAQCVANCLENKVKDNDRILCLGDSITWGAGLIGAGTVTGETYPAWLKTILNFNLKLSKEKIPPAYVKPKAMQIANSNFEDDQINTVPLDWANSDKSGKAIVVEEKGNKFLRISTNNISFSRTNGIIAKNGKWILQFKAKGDGNFNIAATFTNVKPSFVQFHKDWIKVDKNWKSYSIAFNVPKKVKSFMVVLRTKGSNVDFDDFAIIPTGAKKVKSTLSLQSKNAKISFLEPQLGGGVSSLVKDGKVEFVNLQLAKALWKMTLKKIDVSGVKRPEVVKLSVDPERDDNGSGKNSEDHESDINISSIDFAKAEPKVFLTKNTIIMSWKNLNVGDEKGVLDVQTEIKISADGNSFVFNGSFNNRSKKYTVFYFDYPVIGGIGKVNGNGKKDFLATPFFNGRLIQNPVEKGLFKKDRIYQPNRSGHSMHMDVFYNNNQAIYFGVHDKDQYAKRWDITSDVRSGLTWALRNIPNNMRNVPQVWQIPYPTEIKLFNGDWYDGCQIYRAWALKQKWCKEGPITTRKNLPKWFKDTVEWGQYVANQHPKQEVMMRKFRKDFPQYPLAVFLSYWGHDNKKFHNGDPDRFPLTALDKKVLKALKDNNVNIMGYIQCIGWGDKSPSFLKDVQLAKKNLVRNYYGQFIKWPTNHPEQDLIAYPGKVFTKALGDNIEKMVRAGFRAAYLDSGNHGGTYLNFTPDCSTESGGGTSYISGQHKLLETLRNRARKINPEFCFTAESFWEGNIAHLDGYLVCNTTNAYLEGNRVTAIPLIQTVYSDYTMLHSVWPSRYDLARDNGLGYIAKNALALTWGVTPGWNIFNLLYTYENGDIALKTSKDRYGAYVAGKKYFIEGKLLRQPVIKSNLKQLRVKWHRSYSAVYYDILMDAVLGSVFKGPDGSYALVLYNISEQVAKVNVNLNNSLPNKKYTTLAIYPAKQKFKQTSSRTIDVELPSQVPVIITFNTQK